MDNAAIRSWGKANGIQVNERGNVEPKFVAMYIDAHKAEKPKKEKAVKKEKGKAEKLQTNSDAKALHAEFGEIFSAGTINHVIGQHPNRAREILVTGQDFLDNGMRSRYAAIRKAIAGDEVKRKNAAESAATPEIKGKADKGKGKAEKAPSVAAGTRYGVVLPGGTLVTVGSIAERDNLVSIVPNSVAVEM